MKTTVNGKEIKVFGRNDISVIFTQKVNEMLAQGYMFYFDSGSQGEEGKVCLTNDGGKTVYVFYVHTGYETVDETSWSRADTILITAEKFTLKYAGETLWLGKGEKFFEVKWYCINHRSPGKDVYVEKVEEFKMIEKIQSERWHVRYEMKNHGITLNEKCYKIAVSILNKRSGYKSLKVRHITKIERNENGKYYVYFEKSGNNHCVSL